MGNHMRYGKLAVAVAVTLGLGVAAGLAQEKPPIVKQRQDTMKHQSDAMKAITAYAKGEGGVDQQMALSKIDELLSISPKIPDLFPPGTGIDKLGDKVTEAKPDIWQDWDKFKSIPPQLHSEEEKLAAAIKSGDKQKVADQVAATGKNGCGQCHNTFRIKKS
jgi:cytochrome c556